MSELIKRLIKGAFWIYLFTFISLPLGYAIRILYARMLTVEEFGLFYAVLGLLSFVSIFNDLGFSETLGYFLPRFVVERNWKKIKNSVIYAFLMQTFSAILIALIFWFGASWIADKYFHTLMAKNVLRAFCLYFIFLNISNTIFSVFRGFQKEKYYKSIDVVRLIFVLLFSIIVFIFEKENYLLYISLVWGFIYAFVSVVYSIIIYKKYPRLFKIKAYFDKNLFKDMISYALPAILSASAFMILTKIDVILLTYFKNVEVVGYYTIALAIASITIALLTPLSVLLYPLVSELDKKRSMKKLETIISIIFNFGLFVIIPFSLLFFLFPKEIIIVLFGSKYLKAGVVLQILAIGSIFNVLIAFTNVILGGLGLIKKRMWINFSGAAFNFVFDLIFIPMLSMVGAAIVSSFGWLLIFCISLYYIVKRVKIKLPIKNWIKIILLNIIFVSVIYLMKKFLKTNIYLEAIIIIVIAFAIYFILSILIKVIDYKALINEVDKYIKIIKKRI